MPRMASLTKTQAGAGPIDRQVEILLRSKQAFAQKGFDGASMQDLARAAGMSAGNFYRYFPSKDAIIVALVGLELAQIEATFTNIIRSPDPLTAFLDNIEERLAELANENTGAIWAEIEAGARRRGPVGLALDQLMTAIHDRQMRLFSHISGLPLDVVADRFGAQADLILLLIRGAGMTTCTSHSPRSTPQDNAALHTLILHTIRSLLVEIASQKRS
jgi:AcrR family transcriptional regulator